MVQKNAVVVLGLAKTCAAPNEHCPATSSVMEWWPSGRNDIQSTMVNRREGVASFCWV
jgi:hypothetical protein